MFNAVGLALLPCAITLPLYSPATQLWKSTGGAAHPVAINIIANKTYTSLLLNELMQAEIQFWFDWPLNLVLQVSQNSSTTVLQLFVCLNGQSVSLNFSFEFSF